MSIIESYQGDISPDYTGVNAPKGFDPEPVYPDTIDGVYQGYIPEGFEGVYEGYVPPELELGSSTESDLATESESGPKQIITDEGGRRYSEASIDQGWGPVSDEVRALAKRNRVRTAPGTQAGRSQDRTVTERMVSRDTSYPSTDIPRDTSLGWRQRQRRPQ